MINILNDFICFSIIGYLGEIIHCSINGRKSGKALRGPWCPLYGIGGLIILSIINTYNKNILIVFLLGSILSSIVEYFTSVILEIIFKTRWWDYSDFKYNLNGRICLKNSILFGILTLVIYYGYLPFKELILDNINIIIYNVLTIVISITMLIDGVISFIEAYELKYMLDTVDKYSKDNKKLISKLKKFKSNFNYKRLLYSFEFIDDKRIKLLKKFYKNNTK